MAAIVNHDGAKLTMAALRSILPELDANAGHAVVIDNGSEQAAAAALQADLPPAVTWIRLAVNGGYAAACNVACRIAAEQGIPYVWLLNNDLLFEPGALRALLMVADRDPSIAAVAPVTVNVEWAAVVLGAGVKVDPWWGRAQHRFQGQTVAALPAGAFAVDAIEGASPLIRTSALGQIGLLDEGFFMYWEDTEWSQRAVGAGYTLWVEPSARVRHRVAQSSIPMVRIELMMRNRIRFMRLRGSLLQQVTFGAYFFALWLPAYVFTRLVPRFGLRPGLRTAWSAATWNVEDARRRGHWRLTRADQTIPPLVHEETPSTPGR